MCVLIYLLLWLGWAQQWNIVTALDDALLDPAARYGRAHPGWVHGWDALCTIFTPTVWRVVLLVPIGWLLWRRQLRAALFLLVTVEGSALVLSLAKWAAGRSRPESALVHAAGSSFPSGHALGMLVIVTAVLIAAWPRLRPGVVRQLSLAAGVLVILSVGVGRVILNVHHPSDVLAGWALGAALLLLSVQIIAPRRQATAERALRPGSGDTSGPPPSGATRA